MLITTTPNLEGMRIVCYLNIVYGEVIMATDAGQDFMAGFSNFFGGRSGVYEEALAEARQNAIEEMKKRGCKNIKLMVLVAAPQGIDMVQEQHPDVDIYAGAVDEKLNEVGYIVPGLGDAGDRIFGTK